jgi:hypothetical protein
MKKRKSVLELTGTRKSNLQPTQKKGFFFLFGGPTELFILFSFCFFLVLCVLLRQQSQQQQQQPSWPPCQPA